MNGVAPYYEQKHTRLHHHNHHHIRLFSNVANRIDHDKKWKKTTKSACCKLLGLRPLRMNTHPLNPFDASWSKLLLFEGFCTILV